MNFVSRDRLHVFITQETTEEYINRIIEMNDLEKIVDKNTNIYVSGSEIFNTEFKRILEENGYNKIYMAE